MQVIPSTEANLGQLGDTDLNLGEGKVVVVSPPTWDFFSLSLYSLSSFGTLRVLFEGRSQIHDSGVQRFHRHLKDQEQLVHS